MAKRGTKTSSFGVGKRESHDSSRFYESNLYAHINTAETEDVETPPDDPSWANKIYTADSRDMSFIPDGSLLYVGNLGDNFVRVIDVEHAKVV